jgi:hypothetical protein
MEAIVITEDDLNRLEKRFGPGVRRMGPWNSDGVFGYSSVPIIVVEKAAEALENPDLEAALSRLKYVAEQTRPFLELLETFGPALIERIVAIYGECCLELITGSRPAPEPPRPQTRALSVATAA